MALVGPVGPSFLSELQSSTNFLRGPGGLSEGGPYMIKPYHPSRPKLDNSPGPSWGGERAREVTTGNC